MQLADHSKPKNFITEFIKHLFNRKNAFLNTTNILSMLLNDSITSCYELLLKIPEIKVDVLLGGNFHSFLTNRNIHEDKTRFFSLRLLKIEIN